jgi:hypothetical protein
MQKVLLATLFAAASAVAPLGAKVPMALSLRGGAQLGGIDEKTMLLIQAAGAGMFGAEFMLPTWASTRYWDEPKPSSHWRQLSEAFGIGLLITAKQAHQIATTGGDIAAYGKTFTYAWIAWTLMHVKWHQEGSLISTGKYKGQVGGGAACAIVCALSVYTFFM